MSRPIFFIFIFGLCYVVSAQDGGEETENFEYPCDSTDDWDCIRDFLASTGQCERTSYEDGVPLETEDIYTYVPSQNISLATKETKVTMYGSKILDFYLNRDTNNLIMTVDFDNLYLESPRVIFEFARVGKEPVVREEFVSINYSAIITITIAWSDHIEADDLRASGYVKDSNPRFIIGPKITESENEVINRAYNGFLGDIPNALRELWLTKAYYYTCFFLNQKLCDFGFLYDGRVNRA